MTPMNSNTLADIIIALGSAYDYGTAASMNSDAGERAILEGLMLKRFKVASDHVLKAVADLKQQGRAT